MRRSSYVRRSEEERRVAHVQQLLPRAVTVREADLYHCAAQRGGADRVLLLHFAVECLPDDADLPANQETQGAPVERHALVRVLEVVVRDEGDGDVILHRLEVRRVPDGHDQAVESLQRGGGDAQVLGQVVARGRRLRDFRGGAHVILLKLEQVEAQRGVTLRTPGHGVDGTDV